MKTETPCPICGAVVEHDLPPGEDFECPNCKATVIVPDPKEREEWPAPAVGDPTFTPDRRAALLRALRAKHENGELPEGSEAFVASMFSPSRLESIGKRAKSGADLSEADALYMEHYTPVYAAAVDEIERRVKRKRTLRRLAWAAVIVFALVRGCSCLVRSAEKDMERRAAARAANPAPSARATPPSTTRPRALTPPPTTRPAKPAASSAWKVTRRTDPVTDARFVTARTTGAMISVGGIMRLPEFALRRGPDGVEALFSLGGEGANFPRAGSVVTLRLDDAPAEETAWGPSEDRSVLFYRGDAEELARRLRSASRLIVRASTTLGHAATATFDLAGLRAAWDDFQR